MSVVFVSPLLRLSSYGKKLPRNFSSCCFSLCLFIPIFFPLANTTIPKLQEVKENMTMGTTLVTSPDGGFLVRATEFLLWTYTKCPIVVHSEAVHGPVQCMFSEPLHSAVSTLRVSHRGFTSWKCNRRLWIKCRNARWRLQEVVMPALLFFPREWKDAVAVKNSAKHFIFLIFFFFFLQFLEPKKSSVEEAVNGLLQLELWP